MSMKEGEIRMIFKGMSQGGRDPEDTVSYVQVFTREQLRNCDLEMLRKMVMPQVDMFWMLWNKS